MSWDFMWGGGMEEDPRKMALRYFVSRVLPLETSPLGVSSICYVTSRTQRQLSLPVEGLFVQNGVQRPREMHSQARCLKLPLGLLKS